MTLPVHTKHGCGQRIVANDKVARPMRAVRCVCLLVALAATGLTGAVPAIEMLRCG